MTNSKNIKGKIIWRAMLIYLTLIGTFIFIRYLLIDFLHVPSDSANKFIGITFVICLIPSSYAFYSVIMRDYYGKDVHSKFFESAVSSPKTAKYIMLFLGLVLIPLFYLAIYYTLVLFYGILLAEIFGGRSFAFLHVVLSLISLIGATAGYYFLYRFYAKNDQ